MKQFLCYECRVIGIPMSTTATIVNDECEMSPYPCSNEGCRYYNTSKQNITEVKE